MPTRLLREGILTSDRVDQLDPSAEVFYRRLMSKVDDHGLYDARPSILRTSLYPLRVDRVREADITRWIAMCEKAGLIALYEADGKPYLLMRDTGWEKRSKAKFPLPPESICKQPQTPVPVVVVVDEVEVVDERARKRAVFELPEWVPKAEWADFLESRKKHPPTDRAKRELVAKLALLRDEGNDPAKVLLQSTVNSWRDLFPLRTSGAAANGAASLAWAEFRAASREGKRPAQWSYPQTAQALEAIGGWEWTRNATSQSIDYAEGKFKAAFNQVPLLKAVGGAS